MLQDVVDGARVCEAMPNIDFIMSMFLPWDVPAQVSDRYQMETMLVYSRKPIVFVTWDLSGCVDAVAMAAEVAGGLDELRLRPHVACYVNVATSLRHNQEAVEKLLYLAERGLPVLYVPGVARGTTGPITIAGSMVMSNACQLTGLVLSQLKREGTPFVRGFGGATMDMRTLLSCYAAPERSRAASDLAHYYSLPIFGFGGCSDSKVLDEQAAIDATTSLMVEALSGASLIHDVGYLESGLTGSLEFVAICDDIIGWIRRAMQPIEINAETLAVEIIDQVGPDGQFLDTEHTFRHFREDWTPRFMDRHNRATWDSLGRPTMAKAAHDKVMEIISAPARLAVSAEVARRVQAVRATSGVEVRV